MPRYLSLVRIDETTAPAEGPSQELMQRMGELIEEVTKAGVMLATDGLLPSAKGKRIRLKAGKVTIIDGPFTESKELVASYALFQVKSMDEAIHWTRRFLEVLGEGECELRPIFDAGDFSPDVFPPEQAAREEKTRQAMRKNAKR